MYISTLPKLKATFDRIHLFLELPEVVRVLTLCRDLRNDTALTGIVLATNEHTRHFYQFCPFDWFQLVPWFCVDNGDLRACNQRRITTKTSRLVQMMATLTQDLGCQSIHAVLKIASPMVAMPTA
ncbi:hypothetical protein PINS_up022446 [Pythium insidiosum]|nr:hypothetical protein PINS_up022446 [Pythium insidiosum]